jgi:hypothetical protein
VPLQQISSALRSNTSRTWQLVEERLIAWGEWREPMSTPI